MLSVGEKKLVGRAVRSYQRKGLVEDHLSLDVSDFTPFRARIGRKALLSWQNGQHEIGVEAFPDSLRVAYTIRDNQGEKLEHDYSIRLEKTACHFGGVRPWFLCPRCSRRSRILYMEESLNPVDCVFACRLCLGLTYRNQQAGRFMTSAYDWDDKGLPLLKRAMRARKPERKARLLERASKYDRGFWDIIEETDRKLAKWRQEREQAAKRYRLAGEKSER